MNKTGIWYDGDAVAREHPILLQISAEKADNSPGQLWLLRHLRQFTWRHVLALPEDASLQRLFARVHLEYAHRLGTMNRGEMESYGSTSNILDQVETQFFGQVRTVGRNWNRWNFWRMAALKQHGLAPSELAVTIDPVQGYVRRLEVALRGIRLADENDRVRRFIPQYEQRLAEVQRLRAGAGHADTELHPLLAARSTQNDLVETQLSAASLREYAQVYLSAGHTPDTLAYPLANEEDGKLRHLELAGMREPTPADAKRAWQPLSYWLHFMLTSPRDLPQVRPTTAELVTPIDLTVTAASRRSRLEDIGEIQRAAYRDFPMSMRPLLPLMAEFITLQGAPLGITELTQTEVDVQEAHLFGKVMTVGEIDDRRDFWRYLCTRHRTSLRQCPVVANKPQHQVEIAMSVEGYLREGLNPLHKCRLVNFGRGGLSYPMGPEEAPDHDSYKSLAYWAEFCDWSANYVQSWLTKYQKQTA